MDYPTEYSFDPVSLWCRLPEADGRELAVLALLVRELERFGHARRCRMLAYLTDLFGPSYNAEKETDD